MVMKRLSVLAMAMIVMASCAKENVQPNNEPTGEKALLEIGLASTKTQLGEEDKVNKLWLTCKVPCLSYPKIL